MSTILPPEQAIMGSCMKNKNANTTAAASPFTVQNHGKDIHVFLGRSKENYYSVVQSLQDSVDYDTVERVHIVIENGKYNHGDPEAFPSLLRAAADLPKLTEVSIAINQARWLSGSDLVHLLTSAPQLEILKFHDFVVTQSLYPLAEALRSHPSLHTVEMIQCHCRPVHVLIEALASMREVRLDGTILRQQRDGDAVVALQRLCRSCHLERLVLVDIPEVGVTQQFIAMMEALQKATGLRELTIQVEPHEILPIGVINAVAKMLARNHSITRLSISWMAGCELLLPIIEDGIAHNTTLKDFRFVPGLHCSKTNDQVAVLSPRFRQRVADVLRANTTLTYLWVDSWLDIDREIDLYMRANQLGRGYLLQPCSKKSDLDERPSHEAWAEALVASRDRVHLSFYWLTHNPSLLPQHYY